MTETTRIFPEDTLGGSWVTWNSHPASRTAYQEVEEDQNAMISVMWARITVEGREVVSPSTDTDQVYREYQGRVQRAIEEMERAEAARTACTCKGGPFRDPRPSLHSGTCPVWARHHGLA